MWVLLHRLGIIINSNCKRRGERYNCRRGSATKCQARRRETKIYHLSGEAAERWMGGGVVSSVNFSMKGQTQLWVGEGGVLTQSWDLGTEICVVIQQISGVLLQHHGRAPGIVWLLLKRIKLRITICFK